VALWAAACGDEASGPRDGILPRAGRLLLVVNRATGTLSYVDRQTLEVEQTGALGSDLHAIVVDAPRGRAFITNQASARILTVDLARGSVILESILPGARRPHGLALSRDRSQLYVSFPAQNELGIFDLSTGGLVATAPSGGNRPEDLALSSDGETLYVSHIGPPGAVSVVDARTLTVLGVMTAEGPVEGARPDPAGTILVMPVVGSQGSAGQAILLVLPELRVVARLGLGRDPRAVEFSLDGDLAFITNRVSSTLSVIDLASLTVRSEVATVDGPESLLADPSTGGLFVSGGREGQVGVHDPEGRQVTSIRVGARPDALALWDR
jgi:YVTN family beta-propeller protein